MVYACRHCHKSVRVQRRSSFGFHSLIDVNIAGIMLRTILVVLGDDDSKDCVFCVFCLFV